MEAGKRKGLTNRTVTGASLGLISVRGEYIADYLDALEKSLDELQKEPIPAAAEQTS